jgi:hypothetical protein
MTSGGMRIFNSAYRPLLVRIHTVNMQTDTYNYMLVPVKRVLILRDCLTVKAYYSLDNEMLL